MDNATSTLYAPLWVSEPSGRGTWGILYSCVFTLSICVWSAIHLNIPPKGEPDSYQYWRKTKWVFVAIFAPEAVLYSAWQQFYLARRFSREMQNICRVHHGRKPIDPRTFWERWVDNTLNFFRKKLNPEDGDGDQENDAADAESLSKSEKPAKGEKPSKTEKLSQEDQEAIDTEIASFSMTYGFYVIMGGFVVNTSDIYDHERAQWLTVTARGIIEFSKTLPWKQFTASFSIDESQVKDKSKADCLTKLLVIFQVLWAALNSLSRLVLNYQITVLEVHTLVHAACALMMYILWFRKPLDIRDPTVVNTDLFHDRLALMLVRAPGSALLPWVDFKLPGKWRMSVGDSSQWPDKDDVSEAAFLMLDPSKAPGVREDVAIGAGTYSIIPDLPDQPPKSDTDESSSPADNVVEDSDPQTSASEPSSSPQASSSYEERDEGVGDTTIWSKLDRIAQQDGLEATIGVNLEISRGDDKPSESAAIWRRPPTVHRKCAAGVGVSVFHKSRSSARPKASLRLTTGEFLACGIGPAALITEDKNSYNQEAYERYSKRFSKWLAASQPIIDHLYRPVQADLIQVDPRLKRVIAVPRAQWEYNSDVEEKQPPHLEDTYVHKLFAELSQKDVTRWTRAGSAFRLELAEQETSKSTDVLSTALQASESSPKLVSLWKARVSSDEAMFDLSEFCYRDKNFNSYSLGQLTDKGLFLAMYIAMSYISSIYAGIHLALWDHDFPTKAESILWKISGITLGVPAPIFVIVNCGVGIFLCRWPIQEIKRAYKRSNLPRLKGALHAIYEALDDAIDSIKKRAANFGEWLSATSTRLGTWFSSCEKALRAKSRFFGRMLDITGTVFTGGGLVLAYTFIAVVWVCLFGPLVALGLLYVFSRIYIVLESFLSLRHVPMGVYSDVSWAQYIPHL